MQCTLSPKLIHNGTKHIIQQFSGRNSLLIEEVRRERPERLNPTRRHHLLKIDSINKDLNLYGGLAKSFFLCRFNVPLPFEPPPLLRKGLPLDFKLQLWGLAHSATRHVGIPKVFSGVVQATRVLPIPTWANHVLMELALCTGTPSCWNRFGSFRPSLDTTAYKDILYYSVLPIPRRPISLTVWQMFQYF